MWERVRAGVGSCKAAIAASRIDLEVLIERSGSSRNRLVLAATNRGVAALLLHRMGRGLRAAGWPVLPEALTRIAQRRYGIDISLDAEIHPGVTIVHGYGLVVGARSVVERGCSLYHGVTLGNRLAATTGGGRPDGCPHLHEGVTVGAGAKILGPVEVGARSVIGANAVVVEDVPASAVVGAARPVVLRQR